ncbi:MAG: histidine phosphatase family protein [Sporichthyaceae bacterium]
MVWRHGQTAWNLEGRFQGQSEVPLDEIGLGQARDSARILAALEPAAIVSSDLGRACATAAELASLTGLPVSYDPGFRETYLGEWEGCDRAEVEARFPGEAAAWLAGGLERRGGGEHMTEVADRAVAAALKAVSELSERQTLVVVTHGGSGRVLLARLMGLPTEHWRVLGGLANCSWSMLAERPAPGGEQRWVLVEHNAGTLPQPVLSDDR